MCGRRDNVVFDQLQVELNNQTAIQNYLREIQSEQLRRLIEAQEALQERVGGLERNFSYIVDTTVANLPRVSETSSCQKVLT